MGSLPFSLSQVTKEDSSMFLFLFFPLSFGGWSLYKEGRKKQLEFTEAKKALDNKTNNNNKTGRQSYNPSFSSYVKGNFNLELSLTVWSNRSSEALHVQWILKSKRLILPVCYLTGNYRNLPEYILDMKSFSEQCFFQVALQGKRKLSLQRFVALE